MKKNTHILNLIFINGVISLFLLFFFEGLIRVFVADIHPIGEERELFQLNKYKQSYGYRHNASGISFGATVLTDENGFRLGETTSV